MIQTLEKYSLDFLLIMIQVLTNYWNWLIQISRLLVMNLYFVGIRILHQSRLSKFAKFVVSNETSVKQTPSLITSPPPQPSPPPLFFPSLFMWQNVFKEDTTFCEFFKSEYFERIIHFFNLQSQTTTTPIFSETALLWKDELADEKWRFSLHIFKLNTTQKSWVGTNSTKFP